MVKCCRWGGGEQEKGWGCYVPVTFTDIFVTPNINGFGDLEYVSCIFGDTELKYFRWKMSNACTTHT